MAAKLAGMVDPRPLLGLPTAVLLILAVAFAPVALWFAMAAALLLGAGVSVADARRSDGGGLGLPPVRSTASE